MSDNPPDDEKTHHGEHREEVQDYLDSLLSEATERPEAHISHIPERSERPQTGIHSYQSGTRLNKTFNKDVSAKAAQPLTMVGGTLASVPDPGPANAVPVISKPFAEPSKTLAFKVPLPKVEPVADKVIDKPVVEEQAKTPAAPATSPEVDESIATQVQSQPSDVASDLAVEPAVSAEAGADRVTTTEWLDNGRPSWAQQQFECLLFSVGGLTLAVPLVELGTIYPVSDELTPIFGQIDWFMGLLPVKDANIRTVNTAKVVMPERYSETMKEQVRYVISINDMDWGLAVDSVSNAITLDPEAVRWRSQRSKRPWLAGTVVEHMCALLDVSQLAAMFMEQDGKR